jgi:diguanylate cyclase (GGDEF)-like protein
MAARVLVVDDEDTIRGILVQVLADEGYDVVEAASGEQALELYRSRPFELVLTDLYLGRMNGIELLDEIKLINGDAAVVLITSNASLETATSALRAGACDYLLKPFEDIGDVADVARRAIERVRSASASRELLENLKRSTGELERVNAALTDLVNREALTGLHNHRFFREELERELNRARRHGRTFALIFLDVDGFKKYNDNHGHLCGDELLRTLARLLEERCRESTLTARYGGDEFVLLVPEIDAQGGAILAERIRAAVESHPFPDAERQTLGRVTVSAGVAAYPEAGQDGRVLIDNADKALYLSKHRGRNRVSVFRPTS